MMTLPRRSPGRLAPAVVVTLLAVAFGWSGTARSSIEEEVVASALEEVNRIRGRLEVTTPDLPDVTNIRMTYGRPAVEVEGWRKLEDGSRWPVDQATYDVWSGLLSKYVNFDNSSRRRRGEPILPMSAMSSKADAYVNLFYEGSALALEGVERYRVVGKESVYYQYRYSPRPQEVTFLRPLMEMLFDASTGKLYRFELAADYLGAGHFPKSVIGGTAAARIAGLFLRTADLASALGANEVAGELYAADLYYVRPNGWLGGRIPEGGRARPAWVVPFRTDADQGKEPHLLFVDAENGRVIGGLRSTPAP